MIPPVCAGMLGILQSVDRAVTSLDRFIGGHAVSVLDELVITTSSVTPATKYNAGIATTDGRTHVVNRTEAADDVHLAGVRVSREGQIILNVDAAEPNSVFQNKYALGPTGRLRAIVYPSEFRGQP